MLGNILKKVALKVADDALKDFQYYRQKKGGHWELWRVGHPINEERWYQIDTRTRGESNVVVSETGEEFKINQDMEKLAEEDW